MSTRKPVGIDWRIVAESFRILSDPTRIAILHLFDQSASQITVSQLCDQLSAHYQATITPPAIAHQLAQLKHGRLVIGHREGKQVWYQLTPEGHRLVRHALAMQSGDF